MLSDKTMLVFLSINQPSLTRTDRKVTEEVTTSHGCEKGAALVVKHLFDPDGYKPIKQLINTIRAYHYDRTLPWLDTGQRILSSRGFEQYTDTMRGFRSQFDTLVENFCDDYQSHLERAKLRLNGMFNAGDYPTPEDLRCRFELHISYAPVPSSGDFRVDGIDESEAEHIRQALDVRQLEAQEVAMKEAYRRLFDVVARVSERLGDPKGRIHNSLTEAVEEISDVLPTLNIAEDPNLDGFLGAVRQKIHGYSADQFRNDPVLRKDVAVEAQKICDDMAAWMGG